jgi:hypothetical protein
MPRTNAPQDAAATIKTLQQKDPGLKRLLKEANGYAVFPTVGKAAAVIGGGFGRGEVFERGKRIGFATIAQLTLGLQLGGDTFTELIVFKTPQALERFKKGKTAFDANASAVLVKAGAASSNNYEKDVAVYVYADGGMLGELSLGGQKFKFKPAEQGQDQGQDEGEEEDQGEAQSRGGEEEQDEDQDEGEQDEEGSGSGPNRGLELAGRAVGGVRTAASKATEMIKRHPVAATVAGIGVAAGLGMLLVRAMRGAGGEQGEGEEENEDQDEGAQDSAEDQSNEGEEQEEEDDESLPPRLRSRSRSRA